MGSFRSLILFLISAPLIGLGSAVSAGGADGGLVLLVPGGALLAAAGLTILRDPDDVANHVHWGWSTVGQGRSAGIFTGFVLAGFGIGLLIYGAVRGAQALAG